jgi:CheY-like chemotaxis protein
VISESKPLKILLVEDEPIAMLVHRCMLEDMEYKPDVAENGKEALALATNDYDLILMDIGLPDMDGIKVTAEIRHLEKKENKKRSCIIALTAYSLEEVRDKCFAVGMDDIASKPIEANALQQLITKFCG